MFYIYVFPVCGFDRDITDCELQVDYAKRKNNRRYTLKKFIDLSNDEIIHVDNCRIRTIKEPDVMKQNIVLHNDFTKKSEFKTGR